MRVLTETNRLRNGLMGVVVLLLVVAVGQNFANLPMLFAKPTYYAQFKDTGGINVGDKVQISGVDVGLIRSVEIQDDKVVIGFALGARRIGSDSRAMIRTDTVLGRRNLAIENRGSQRLRAHGVLPIGQTTTPYQIYDAFTDVTGAASGWETDTVKESLNVLSQTLDQTAPHLNDALKGIERFSDSIGKRDEQIKQLLDNANKIATVVGDGSDQINRLLVNAQSLLAAVNERGQAIDYVLERVSAISAQVSGFISDNQNLNKVLEQLRTVSDILRERRFEVTQSISTLSRYALALGEGVASGPFFKAMLVNLLPYQALQPFVDAAFKKRGVDPENFWRDAGLPAFQFPDPNGTGFSNGAPPPAPTPLEGTPENPLPAVPKGSPCSYTPPADGLPRPENPLPCADLTVGPFGDNPYGPNYAGQQPNVATSAPDAHGPQPAPGVPAAAIPGQPSPDVPGARVPLPPAPPGARTVPLEPLPSAPDVGPGIAPLPPALVGPPPPKGPGPQPPPAGQPLLPGNPPFLPPGSQS